MSCRTDILIALFCGFVFACNTRSLNESGNSSALSSGLSALPSQTDYGRYPGELFLGPAIQSSCALFGVDQSSYRFGANHESLQDLERLANCLSSGPLAEEPLELVGDTHFPGRLSAPIDGGGHADGARALLVRLGVPLERFSTRYNPEANPNDPTAMTQFRVDLILKNYPANDDCPLANSSSIGC